MRVLFSSLFIFCFGFFGRVYAGTTPEFPCLTSPNEKSLLPSSNYSWVGEELSAPQWSNLVRYLAQIDFHLDEDTSFTVIEPNYHGEKTLLKYHNGTQRIRPIEQIEKHFLLESQVDQSPRQVVGVLFRTLDDRLVDSNIVLYAPDSNGFVDFDDVENQIATVLNRRVDGLKSIEVVMTKPFFEVLIKKDNKSYIRTLQINSADIEKLKPLRAKVPSRVHVILRAVIPNGFTYELAF